MRRDRCPTSCRLTISRDVEPNQCWHVDCGMSSSFIAPTKLQVGITLVLCCVIALIVLSVVPTDAWATPAAGNGLPRITPRRTFMPTNRPKPTSLPTSAVGNGAFNITRLDHPARSVVTDEAGSWLATFTDGASTVTLVGPTRTFHEKDAGAPVVTSVWVRLLPTPFGGDVPERWLATVLADSSPDLLQIAMQYIQQAPPIYDANGMKIAGDANYGPLERGKARQEGSDFNDYLGIAWTYRDERDEPEPDQLGSLDCSGFIRMVWGYRGGLPLALRPNGIALPRRSFEMLESAPGVVLIPDTGKRPTDLSRLAPGDLLFFDASSDDSERIDHVGMYLGRDTAGAHRFISSRKTINGPTLSDYGGRSTLDGTGTYAKSLRAARRL